MTAAGVSVRGHVRHRGRLLVLLALAHRAVQALEVLCLPRLAAETAHETERGARSFARTAHADTLGAECERFIEQHQRTILNYLWRMTGDEQAAYDLTQEVFVRAWQRFDAVHTYERPLNWLFRVATNLALTHLKRRASPVADAGPLDDALSDASGDPVWRLAESDHVRRTLLQLSPKRRAALVLREVYGLSAAEVGQMLGMSDAAVRMALHRAREQFREIYRQGDLPPGRSDAR